MKKLVTALITLLILLSINFFASKVFNISFLELSFFTGLICSCIIAFFTSKGGVTTAMHDFQAKVEYRTNFQPEDNEFFKLYFSTPLLISLLYTISSAMISITIYWKYF